MKRSILFAANLATAASCFGAPGAVPLPDGVQGAAIERNGSVTTVRLLEPARIEWSRFRVERGETLRYDSGGRGFASLNRAHSASAIDGLVTADGPFYLISPAGIHIGASGRVVAPQVLLSALSSAADTDLPAAMRGTFSHDATAGNGRVLIEGTVDSGTGTTAILGSAVSLARSARVTGGVVQVMAAANRPVQLPGGISANGEAAGGSGSVNNEGWIQARRVEIFAEGFVRNGGRLLTEGPGNELHLSGTRVTHELRPDNASLIRTSKLVVPDNRFVQEGPVLTPDDGANPSAIGGLRQTPRLSAPGFVTEVTAGQTQLSHAPLQSARLTASPIPPRRQPPTVLATRRGPEPAATATVIAGARAPRPKETENDPGTVRKGSFFGQRVRH